MPNARLALILLLAAGPAECAAPPVAREPAISDTDWAHYGAQLRAAHRAWELGRVAEAWRELEDCRWDLRGWEHRHLCALLMRNQAVLSRDGSRAEFTPDGHILTYSRAGLSLRDGRTFEPIEAATGAGLFATTTGTAIRIHRNGVKGVVRSWEAHVKPLSALTMSRDGTRVASGSADGSAFLWDAASGKKVLDLTGHEYGLDGFGFSADGSRLVSASLHLIRVSDTRTGRIVGTRTGNNVSRVGAALSPDGRRVLSASDGYDTALLWDADTGRESMRFRVKDVRLMKLALCPDGMTAATGHADGTIRLWETRTGRLLETFRGHETGRFGIRDGVVHLSFSPEGARLLSTGDDGTVRMWDARPTTIQTKYHSGMYPPYAENRILSVSGTRFVNLSTTLSFGSNFPTSRHLSAWDFAKGHRLYLHDLDLMKGPQCFAVSPDGKLLATGEPWGVVRIRDTATGLPVRSHLQHVYDDVTAVAWSPDGRRIASATGSGGVHVCEASTGRHVSWFSGPPDMRWIAYSPDGTLLACAGGDVLVFDARTGAIRYRIEGEGGPGRFGFSPDGTTFLRSTEYELKVHDAPTGRPLFAIDPGGSAYRKFTYSPDRTRLITWSWETMLVREGKSGRVLLKLPTNGRNAFAFRSDGRLYSAAGLALAPLWEERVGYDAYVLQESEGYRTDMIANKDGSVIVYRSGGPEVVAWEVRTGKLLFRDRVEDRNYHFCFTKDGKTLVAHSFADPKIPTRHWVVRAGGKPPKDTDALDHPDPMKLGGGYRVERRRGRVALIHESEAAEDRAPMARWAEPDIAWHRRRLSEATLDGDDGAAEHHLRFLLRDPIQRQDAELHVHLAHILARRGRPNESAAALAWALLLNPRVNPWPTCDGLWGGGEQRETKLEWDRTVRRYRMHLNRMPREVDPEQYDSRPREMFDLVLAEIAASVPPASRYRPPEWAYWRLGFWEFRLASCLPVSPGEARGLLMSAEASHRARYLPETLANLGAAQYRAGRYEDAADSLSRATSVPLDREETFARLFLALAEKRLGHDDEANAALARAEALRKARRIADWRERVALDALFAEARAALTAPPTMPRVPDDE